MHSSCDSIASSSTSGLDSHLPQIRQSQAACRQPLPSLLLMCRAAVSAGERVSRLLQGRSRPMQTPTQAACQFLKSQLQWRKQRQMDYLHL